MATRRDGAGGGNSCSATGGSGSRLAAGGAGGSGGSGKELAGGKEGDLTSHSLRRQGPMTISSRTNPRIASAIRKMVSVGALPRSWNSTTSHPGQKPLDDAADPLVHPATPPWRGSPSAGKSAPRFYSHGIVTEDYLLSKRPPRVPLSVLSMPARLPSAVA